MLHYMPGCDVRKNHPTEIEKLTAYMKNKGAVIDNCCRDEESFIEKLYQFGQQLNNMHWFSAAHLYPSFTSVAVHQYAIKQTSKGGYAKVLKGKKYSESTAKKFMKIFDQHLYCGPVDLKK